jgi:hypothetical protein
MERGTFWLTMRYLGVYSGIVAAIGFWLHPTWGGTFLGRLCGGMFAVAFALDACVEIRHHRELRRAANRDRDTLDL